MSHLVVCTSKLEGEDWLQVLALEEDFAIEAVGEVDGMSQWCFVDDFVNAGGEDETEILLVISFYHIL